MESRQVTVRSWWASIIFGEKPDNGQSSLGERSGRCGACDEVEEYGKVTEGSKAGENECSIEVQF